MPNSHETAPETPDNPIQLMDRMNPKERQAMLDRITDPIADTLTPVVREVRNMSWVKKLHEKWQQIKAEKTPEELKEMFVKSNLDSLKDLIPLIPSMPDVPNPKEFILKTLLLTGAIGGLEDEALLSLAGEKNTVQTALLFIVKIWGKIDPEVEAANELIKTYLSIEGFGLAVCTKLRQNIHNPELMQAQPVVAEVDHEREGTSATVGVPTPDHVHDVDEDIAAAA